MHFYQVLLFLVQTLLTVEGNPYTIYYATPRNCDYQGYAPGGNVQAVGKIKDSVAKLAKSGISSVLGPVSQASTLAMHSFNTIKAVTGAFQSVAPALGPALGVFGAVTGIFTSLTTPKPKDILNAANAAIGDLTRDVNKKLDEMEGYVDSQLVRIQKNLITRSYDSSWILWSNCVKEASFELAQECQREAYATLVADRPKYAIYADKLKASAQLKNIEARELEAYLVAYRNYANLVVLMLKPLIETYGNDSSSVGQKSFDRYSDDLKENAEFYIWYAKAAVDAILKYHNGSDGHGNCLKSINCGRLNQVDEGSWITVHTADRTYCTCVIDDGTKQSCSIEVTIRADGSYPSDYGTYDYGCTDMDCQAEKYSYRRLAPFSDDYAKKDVKIAKAYWEKELLDFVSVWEDAIKYANDAQSNHVRADVPSGDGEKSDEDFEPITKFSSRFLRRIKKARKAALKHKEKLDQLAEGETLVDEFNEKVKARLRKEKQEKQSKAKN